jgi:hypothetical protein
MKDLFPELNFCGSQSAVTGHPINERHYFSKSPNFAPGTDGIAIDCSSYYSCPTSFEESLQLSSTLKPYYLERVKALGRWDTSNSCADNGKGKQQVGVDYTPTYFFGAETIGHRIKQMYGAHSESLRFIVVLRDPVDRVVSYFTHFQPSESISDWVSTGLDVIGNVENGCWRGKKGYTPAELIEKYARGRNNKWGAKDIEAASSAIETICAGVYVLQLKRWFEHFDAEQFLIVAMNSYIEEPGKVLAAVGKHLNVATEAQQKHILHTVKEAEHVNSAASWHLPSNCNATLSTKVYQRLEKLYGSYHAELTTVMKKAVDEGLHAVPDDGGANGAVIGLPSKGQTATVVPTSL